MIAASEGESGEQLAEPTKQELLEALAPFARVYRINAQLEPDLERGLYEIMPKVWPKVADAKHASDLLKRAEINRAHATAEWRAMIAAAEGETGDAD